ncbi:hypothetical protein [Paenibacillus sp. ATY16]|nr:hypothetical protein [Paenibacillus sp. ATY16]
MKPAQNGLQAESLTIRGIVKAGEKGDAGELNDAAHAFVKKRENA